MKYICGYEPTDGCFPVSMLIQQCECRGRQVFLACLAVGEQGGDELLEQLCQWFRLSLTDGLRAKSMKKLHKGLQRVLQKNTMSLSGGEEVNVAGFFGLGNHAFLFGRGRGELLVAKESYGRAVLEKRMVDEMGEAVSIETSVGIILATPGFADSVSNLQLGQCLRMREIQTEQQLQKQVQELSAYAAKGRPDRGVIVVRSMGD